MPVVILGHLSALGLALIAGRLGYTWLGVVLVCVSALLHLAFGSRVFAVAEERDAAWSAVRALQKLNRTLEEKIDDLWEAMTPTIPRRLPPMNPPRVRSDVDWGPSRYSVIRVPAPVLDVEETVRS